MVEGSFELHDGRWRRYRGYPKWVSWCSPNQKASLLNPGAVVRPAFRDEKFQSDMTGTILQIRELKGDWHADVTWNKGVSVETVPIWALIQVELAD